MKKPDERVRRPVARRGRSSIGSKQSTEKTSDIFDEMARELDRMKAKEQAGHRKK